jgi:hypothetical protein
LNKEEVAGGEITSDLLTFTKKENGYILWECCQNYWIEIPKILILVSLDDVNSISEYGLGLTIPPTVLIQREIDVIERDLKSLWIQQHQLF